MATRFSLHLLLVALTISTLLCPILTSTTNTPPSTRPPPTTATTTPPPSIRPPTSATTTRPPSFCSPDTPPPSIRPPTTATTTRAPSSCSPATSTATPPPSSCPPITATPQPHSTSIPTTSPSTAPTRNWGRTIVLGDLEGNFGRSRKEAAARLGVSESTFKKKCREHGITRWPRRKEIRETSQAETSQTETINEYFDGEIIWGMEKDTILETSGIPSIRDQLAFTPVVQNPSVEFLQPDLPWPPMSSDNLTGTVDQNRNVEVLQPLVALPPTGSENLDSYNLRNSSLALQDTRSILVKAVHGSTILLFVLLVSSGLLGLKEQIAKRLKLKVDDFDVKFKDNEGDLISITCDDDLMMYLSRYTPADQKACKVFVTISKKSN